MYLHKDAHVYLLKERERKRERERREIYTGASDALLAARRRSGPMAGEGSVYSLCS